MTQDVYFYKAEFSVIRSTSSDGFEFNSAKLISTIPADFDPTVRKVAFFPEHFFSVN